MGKSGSGKGTQADLLIEKFGFEYIGSGELLRARAKKNDFTGRKIARVLKKGKLVPTPVIFKLWLDVMEGLKSKKNLKGFVMDGNPRKLFEAYLIDELFEWYDWKNKAKALLLHISDKEAINRLTKRRICQKCKEIIPFVAGFKKIKECHECGGKLIQRSDDTVSAVKKRLSWFKKEVQPIVNYYRKTNRLIKVNGEQPIEKVFKDILKCIK
ncbi:hypothetical protein AMJ47_02530 [Parcubacteria bacterium DG_72]|nr:MAG: hypothetical protein AMJ47_02530 [Parcubacteria bacterium DG_72]